MNNLIKRHPARIQGSDEQVALAWLELVQAAERRAKGACILSTVCNGRSDDDAFNEAEDSLREAANDAIDEHTAALGSAFAAEQLAMSALQRIACEHGKATAAVALMELVRSVEGWG